MNKSLRLETQKNVEALPHWEKFTAGLDGLGVVTAYREILGRAASSKQLSFPISTLPFSSYKHGNRTGWSRV